MNIDRIRRAASALLAWVMLVASVASCTRRPATVPSLGTVMRDEMTEGSESGMPDETTAAPEAPETPDVPVYTGVPTEGQYVSAYGLCHLGDYEATVFSKYSHNRAFGEMFVKGENFGKLAEGYATTRAMVLLGKRDNVELPICEAVYRILYEQADPASVLAGLFERKIVTEFHK